MSITATQAKQDAIDKAILRKLRGAYELLAEAQTMIDALRSCNKGAPTSAVAMALEENMDLLDPHGVSMADYDRSVLATARARINALGGQIYATMNTPYPDPEEGRGDELTDEQWAQHADLQKQYAEHWVSEGKPMDDIRNACHAEHKAEHEATAAATAASTEAAAATAKQDDKHGTA